jgi:hypothetical protein
MKKNALFFLVLVLVWVFEGTLGASTNWEYEYYFPHVVSYPEFYPAHHGYTNLHVIIARDGTSYKIDQDGDGIYEEQYSNLPSGQIDHFGRTNWPHPAGNLSIGGSIQSTEPLQIILQFGINHFSTYDAGYMTASLIPTDLWGNTFFVTSNSTYLYIFAQSQTQVNVSPPGQNPTVYSIASRSNLKLSDIDSGTSIVADNPVYVLAVNCQPDQNFPWMYNVLPVSMLGNEYYHDSTYGEVDISWPWPTEPKLWVTAVTDGSIVKIDENKDGYPEYVFSLNEGESIQYTDPVQEAHIRSNNKIYVASVENWAAPFRGKYGGTSTEYIPTSSYGTDYALYDVRAWREIPEHNPRIFIVASENNTKVDVDFGWDGTDTFKYLNKGCLWAILWPDGISSVAHITSDKDIQVIYRTDLSHPHHPGVMVSYTAVPLDMYKGIEAAIDIDPDTLNLKSKGRWVTAYVELPEAYDVGEIDVSTVTITEIDEMELTDPVSAEARPTSIGDEDGDGMADLMVKFNRQGLMGYLEAGERLITISGALNDGTKLQGSDTIRVIH